MKTFFTSFVLLFLSVIAFNIYVDKNFFWHRYSAFEKLVFQQGDCLKLSGEMLTGNDRLVQKTARRDMPRPDTVVLASSRGAYADFTLFPGTHVYNSAVSISLLEDFIDVWTDLKAHNKIPSEVIIFADGWIFNEAVHTFRSWDSIDGYNSFLKEQGLQSEFPPALKKRHQREKLDRMRQQILNLISFAQTEVSLDLFLNNQYKNLDIKKCDAIDDDLTYMAWMGAHLTKKITPHDTLDKIVAVPDSALSYMEPWQTSDFHVKAFKALVQDMQKHNVTVHVVTPLMQPTAYQHIINHEGVLAFRKIMADLKTVDGLKVCEAYNASEVQCGEYEFKDGIHMTRECTAKLLKYCGIIK